MFFCSSTSARQTQSSSLQEVHIHGWLDVSESFHRDYEERTFKDTQRQVSVDICSEEGTSPQVFGVDQRVH